MSTAAGIYLLPLLPKETSARLIHEHGLVIVREAMYYKKIREDLFRCDLCPNKCTLRKGSRSLCLVREVKDDKLYTFVYGNPTAVHIDPIEKKPLYHFMPGKSTLSIATAGCNFTCLNCQNWQISQFSPEETVNYRMLPEEVVDTAVASGCGVISYTYSEPSVFFEYMYETSRIAKKKGIKNTSVTNGYLNPGPLKELCSYLDASNVDLKGFSDEFYIKVTGGRLAPVLDAIVLMKSLGVHVEITNLLLPEYNDSDTMIKDMCKWILKNTGSNTPLHFSRFSPMYKLKNLQPTPKNIMIRAKEIANDSGLNYVYLGNISKSGGQDTLCHNCGRILIKRTGYFVHKVDVAGGKCRFCNADIPGVWS
ncbi:AmmeMemoRadiSam system radical SAM enzyme [Elusimicrobiota bacterium]